MVFAFFPVEGTWFYSQLDGLGDGRKSVRDPLNFDCCVFSVHAWHGLSRKWCNDDIAFDGEIDVGEESIDLANIGAVTQIIPVFLTIFGSLCNHAIGNCLPHRHAITCDNHLMKILYLIQDSFCGRGKWWLKYVMMLLNVKKYLPFLKARETISAISLLLTATWSGVTLDVLCVWMRRLSILSRVPEDIDTEYIILWSHDTAYVLSQKTGSSPRCPLRSHSLVCIENHLFIIGIGPILNKELEFIYRSDCSDCTNICG